MAPKIGRRRQAVALPGLECRDVLAPFCKLAGPRPTGQRFARAISGNCHKRQPPILLSVIGSLGGSLKGPG